MVQYDDVPAATGEWECMECGYIEEGTQTRRPKECPECGAPGTAFEYFASDEDDDDEWGVEDELDADADAVANANADEEEEDDDSIVDDEEEDY